MKIAKLVVLVMLVITLSAIPISYFWSKKQHNSDASFIRGLAFSLGVNTQDTLMLMFFHPECDYCHAMMPMLEHHNDNFSFVMVCFENDSVVNAFAEEQGWKERSNIFVVSDEYFYCWNTLRVPSIPTSFILNPEAKDFTKRVGFWDIDKYLSSK